jgi:hypothetical protein
MEEEGGYSGLFYVMLIIAIIGVLGFFIVAAGVIAIGVILLFAIGAPMDGAEYADDMDAGLILVPIGMIALAFILGWVDKSLDGW